MVQSQGIFPVDTDDYGVGISFSPSIEEGYLPSHTDISIKCSWQSNGKDGYILIDETAMFTFPQYTELIKSNGMYLCIVHFMWLQDNHYLCII